MRGGRSGRPHYERLHGRSQFFRVKSLAITFGQLVRLWFRLVLMPVVTRTHAVEAPASLR